MKKAEKERKWLSNFNKSRHHHYAWRKKMMDSNKYIFWRRK